MDLAPQTFRVTRDDLVRYAAASGDDNPIHQSEEIAVAVGLPGVIAHGMFTLALAGNALTIWLPHLLPGGFVAELGAKFVKPVVVPDGPEGAEVVVSGTASPPDDDGRVAVSLSVTCAGVKVLGVPRAVLARA